MADNVLGVLFQNIADAIRAKTGGTETMKPNEFPTQIANIPVGGGSSADVRYVTFIGADGATLIVKPVAVGDDCVDVVTKGLISTPTKESTASQTFTYSGWSLTEGGAASSSALKSVTEDRTVYAAFTASARLYWARFYDDAGVLMQESQVAYGTQATPPDTKRDGYVFNGWTPSNLIIRGDTDFVGEWEVDQGWLIKLPAPTYANYTNMANIVYSPDGTRAYANATNRVLIFDTTSEPWTELYSHSYSASGTSHMQSGLCLTSDGKLLIAGHQGNNTETQPGVLMFSVDGDILTPLNRLSVGNVNSGKSVRSIALSPDETELAVAWAAVTQISIFDISTGENTKTLTRAGGTYPSGGKIKYSPCGTKILDICQVATNPLNMYDLQNNGAHIESTYFTNTSIAGYDIAYSPDGKYLAIGSRDTGLLLFDTSTTPYTSITVDMSEYSPSSKSAYGVGFSFDGKLLAFGLDFSPHLGVLDMETLAPKDKPKEHPAVYTPHCAVFNNDATRLVYGLMNTTEPIFLYKVRR